VRRRPLALVALILLAAGCGEKYPPRLPVQAVKGRVTYRGNPAAAALLTFVPVGNPDPNALRPFAVSGDDGGFTLGSYAAGDGAPTGEYVVLVTWAGPKKGPKGDGKESSVNEGLVHEEGQMRDFLAGRYRDPKISPLRVTIDASTSELKPIELK
jgi:hypothetical protein